MLWSVAATRALFCDWKWKWVAQSCLTLCDPVAYTFHGILQAKILEWIAFPFSRGSSQPRDQTQVSRIAGRFITSWTTRKPRNTAVGSLSLLQWIFPTQESNWGLLHCRWILYQLRYQGRPLLEWPSSKSLQVTNIGKDVEARKPVYTVGGNVNWYSHYGKQYGGSSKYKT